jgi:hypothetical protein
MYNLDLENLEKLKEEWLSYFSEGKGSRELRNLLYEMLGVIEYRKRHPDPLILDVESLA